MITRILVCALIVAGASLAQIQCLPANTAATGNIDALTITSNTGNTLPGSVLTLQVTGVIPFAPVDFMFTNCPANFCPYSQPVTNFGTVLFDPFPFVPGVPNLFTDYTSIRTTADAGGTATLMYTLTTNPDNIDLFRFQACYMDATMQRAKLSNECFFIVDF